MATNLTLLAAALLAIMLSASGSESAGDGRRISIRTTLHTNGRGAADVLGGERVSEAVHEADLGAVRGSEASLRTWLPVTESEGAEPT